MRIDDEGAAHHGTVPARELEAVGTPAKVRLHDDHLAVMGLLRTLRVFACQQQVVRLHDPVDALVIGRRQAIGAQLSVQHRVASGCSDHVWMAPAGQGLCSGLAFGRSRPCIRRLSCGIRAGRAP